MKIDMAKDLIDVYGGGFTDYADKNRIQLSRYDLATRNTSVFYITEKQIEELNLHHILLGFHQHN